MSLYLYYISVLIAEETLIPQNLVFSIIWVWVWSICGRCSTT